MALGIFVAALAAFSLHLRSVDERESRLWLTVSTLTAFLGALVAFNP